MHNKPERKRTRLEGFDYSSKGGYFITICTKDKINYFGEIKNSKMILNKYGKIAENEILNTQKIRKNIEIDEFVIMPNHIHFILFVLSNSVGSDCIGPNDNIEPDNCVVPNNKKPIKSGPMQLVPTVMKGLKSTITKQINDSQDDFLFSWQKSYHDRIIRNEKELNKIRKYIVENPLKREYDELNS